ncbi:beta-glucosidase-domain-containing protein [Whalleya microplaca]|nr:beta-glucosidase-domain-containing protein [Whalleya microplaca]
MKVTTIQAALGWAMLLFAAQPCAATVQHQHRHRHLHKKHAQGLSLDSNSYNPRYSARNTSALVSLESRDLQKCKFPEDKGLFAVTPDAMNGGWALAPDQECVSGTWCPIACPPGKVMAQWKPGTHYHFPESTYGGVHCNNGEIEVPFPDHPWCVDGTGTVEAVNKVGEVVAFCQTCLPGYEDMIIPTEVHDTATLSVPDKSYWDSTASHFYVNPPGVSADDACHWGDISKPIGNWAPYVAGANTESDGKSFVKVGKNPEWSKSALADTKPNFGLRIDCPGGGCIGMPCSVDDTGVHSDEASITGDGADFCVVTVPSGGTGHIVVYSLDGSGGAEPSSSSSSASEPTSTQSPTTSSSSTTISLPSLTTPSIPLTSSATSTSSSSDEVVISLSIGIGGGSSITSSSNSSPSSPSSPAKPEASVPFLAGVFQENTTSSSGSSSGSGSGSSWAIPSSTAPPAAASTNDEAKPAQSETNTSESAGQRQGGAAIAGLIIAFVATGYLL